jgi:hypothetical protein
LKAKAAEAFYPIKKYKTFFILNILIDGSIPKCKPIKVQTQNADKRGKGSAGTVPPLIHGQT